MKHPLSLSPGRVMCDGGPKSALVNVYHLVYKVGKVF